MKKERAIEILNAWLPGLPEQYDLDGAAEALASAGAFTDGTTRDEALEEAAAIADQVGQIDDDMMGDPDDPWGSASSKISGRIRALKSNPSRPVPQAGAFGDGRDRAIANAARALVAAWRDGGLSMSDAESELASVVDGLPTLPRTSADPAPDEVIGLYNKFHVRRLYDPRGKHGSCEYFVLDLNHDKFSRPALRAYTQACRETFPELAADLEQRLPILARRFPGECDHGVLLTAPCQECRHPRPEPAQEGAKGDARTYKLACTKARAEETAERLRLLLQKAECLDAPEDYRVLARGVESIRNELAQGAPVPVIACTRRRAEEILDQLANDKWRPSDTIDALDRAGMFLSEQAAAEIERLVIEIEARACTGEFGLLGFLRDRSLRLAKALRAAGLVRGGK